MQVISKTLIALAVGSAVYGAFHFSDQISQDKFKTNKELETSFNALLATKSKKPYDKPQEAIDFAVLKRMPGGKGEVPYANYSKALLQMESMPQYSSSIKQVLPTRAQLKADPGLKALFSKTMADGENVELGHWDNLGPGNIGGRTRTIVVHPENPEIIFTAGVDGGVWRSTNGGENWSPLDDMMPNLAVVTLVMDPDDSDILYAGTGEGFFNGDAVRGNGIFRTTDGGDTWEHLASTADNSNFHFVNKLAISANDSNRLYAATREGIFRSTDAGATWSLVHDGSDVAVGCVDLQIRTDLETDNLVGACGSFLPGRIVRSTDGGDTFATVLAEAEMGRSTIAIAPSNQDVIYALNATNQFSSNNMGSLGLNKVYRSNDGGATWQAQYSVNDETFLSGSFAVPNDANNAGFTLLSNPLLSILPACGVGFQQFFNQGWYDNIISVDPTNPDVVWAGGIDILRSDDGGQSWGLTSSWFLDTANDQYAHADNHIFAFPPNYDGTTVEHMYVGNDGGIQRVNNAATGRTLTVQEYCGISLQFGFGVTPEDFGVPTFVPDESILDWDNLNNDYRVTQFYNGTPFPDGETYFGGTQDNGTLLGTDTAGANAWVEIFGGDGGYVAVDPTNTDVLFLETTGLSIRKSTDGGASFAAASTGITGAGFPFITTFEMDSNNPQRLWILGSEIWRTDDQAENWVQASTTLTASGSAVANAPSNSERVIVGTQDGFIFRNADAGNADATTVWESSDNLGGFISSVAFDPQDENIAYATVSTFGTNHVLRSTDGGATWAAIDNMGEANGIPDIPAHDIKVDPADSRRLFVGTDLGVFVSIDTGANWMIENGGFANTQVQTLKFADRTLFAFTHGRSAYRVELNDLLRTTNSVDVTAEDTALSLTEEGFLDNLDGPNILTPTQIEIIEVTNGVLTVNGESVSAAQSVALADLNSLVFTPDADFNGDASIQWQARDDNDVVSREAAIITINVTPVNDAPVATQVEDFNGRADRFFEQNVSASFSDVDGDTLAFTASGLPLGLTINPDGTIEGTPVAASVTQVTVTASDGEFSASSTFTLTIKNGGSGSFGGLFLLALLSLFGIRRNIKR